MRHSYHMAMRTKDQSSPATACAVRHDIAMSKSPDTQGPLLHVGPDNRGPAVVVVMYILLIISTITTIFRLQGLFSRKRPFNAADGLSIAMTVRRLQFSMSFVIKLTIGSCDRSINLRTIWNTRHGLGQHMSTVSAHDLDIFYKVCR